MRSVTAPQVGAHHDRGKHETRTGGEVRPVTVEAAVRLAHPILAAVGVKVAPAKVAKLCRSFIAADPPMSFRAYLARNAAPSGSLPLPPSRGAVEWLDPTGDTAARNVDAERLAGGVSVA